MTAKIGLVAAMALFFLAIAGTQIIGTLGSIARSAFAEGAVIAGVPVLIFLVVLVSIAGGAIVVAVRAWRGNGCSCSIRNRFRSGERRTLDYGNYRYVTGSGKNHRTHNWGFMALELDRALPHLVLDARASASVMPSMCSRET